MSRHHGRWAALLLLVVLPLTLAPKTSWGPGVLDVSVVPAAEPVAAGDVIAIRVLVAETQGGTTVGDVISVTATPVPDVLRYTHFDVLAMPPGCEPAPDALATCTLQRLVPYQQRTLVFVLRAQADGVASFQADGGVSGS